MTIEATDVGADFGEAGGVGGICIGRIETFALKGASGTGLGEVEGVINRLGDSVFLFHKLSPNFGVCLWSHESLWSQTAILAFALACLE